jgi:4-aminobutyrate aminotransferase-like enzyme
MISSYMLNVKGIRLANALNKMNTLRVQPALIVSREECDTFLGALRSVNHCPPPHMPLPHRSVSHA